ncbi:Signal transduction histidine kinase [Enhydrobacter aerosaccus]|uniref:histidine kinase n=1 Tax=Enhydrobacter aerosaccus TaxID=225324 RepID=A0A1T4SBL9_9HYPH|nr:Signal transduction histidine kinase [Enhydrobacter aerosaccus]
MPGTVSVPPLRILRTIGFRLAAFYAALFAVSVIVLFGIIYWTAGDALRRQLAANVQGEVGTLVDDYRTGGVAHTARTIEKRLSSGLHPATYYLLLDSTGRKAAGNLPPVSRDAGWKELPPQQQEGEFEGDSGEHRLLALGASLPDGAFVLVAEDTHGMVEVQEAMLEALAWALAATILLGAAGGTVLSLGFLRRVDAINRTTRAIIGGRLTDRVPTRGTSDELDELARNLNEMLDRLQMLMESLRQVSSDVAHDLRTPLSRLRQQLEAARLEARSMEDYETAVADAIIDADEILKIFSALLRIAEIEGGARRGAFTTVDLSSVFQSIADTYGPVAEEQGRSLSAAIEPGIETRGDRDLLMQMMANLVENAIRHTPEGTKISIALQRGPSGPLGTIADNGPGIPEEDRQKVFRRFFRLERSRSTGGSGLGLSLVAAVAEMHGIAISLADNAPGLKVELRFS